MKKIIMSLALLCATIAVAEADPVNVVYDFKATIAVPALANGVRTYKNQAFNGQMYMTYDEAGLVASRIEVVNKSTKVVHTIEASDAFYHLMGKSTKSSERSVPTVWFTGADAEETLGHEHITIISLAGKGALKATKTVTTGCGTCGELTKITDYCNVLTSMSGSLVGVMDCQCPDEETWSHTLKAGACGVVDGDIEDIRSHDASFKGTWSAKYNKKLTEAANTL